jgi:hypothetical protein
MSDVTKFECGFPNFREMQRCKQLPCTLSRSCTCTKVVNDSTSVKGRLKISAEKMWTYNNLYRPKQINRKVGNPENMGKYDLHSTPLPCWKHTFLFSFGGYFFRQAHPSEWNITCKHTWRLLPWALHDFFSTDSVLEPSGLNFQSCQLQIFPRFMLGPGAHEVHQVRLAAASERHVFQRA